MTRAKSGLVSKNRHKKIIKMAKGYRGRANNCFRVAIEKVEKAFKRIELQHRAEKSAKECSGSQSLSLSVPAGLQLLAPVCKEEEEVVAQRKRRESSRFGDTTFFFFFFGRIDSQKA